VRWPRDTLYPQNLALNSPTCGGRSIGIVCLWSKATEFSFSLVTLEITVVIVKDFGSDQDCQKLRLQICKIDPVLN
jgi:hypothetical protein